MQDLRIFLVSKLLEENYLVPNRDSWGRKAWETLQKAYCGGWINWIGKILDTPLSLVNGCLQHLCILIYARIIPRKLSLGAIAISPKIDDWGWGKHKA